LIRSLPLRPEEGCMNGRPPCWSHESRGKKRRDKKKKKGKKKGRPVRLTSPLLLADRDERGEKGEEGKKKKKSGISLHKLARPAVITSSQKKKRKMKKEGKKKKIDSPIYCIGARTGK